MLNRSQRRWLELLKRRSLILVLFFLATLVALAVAGAADTGVLLDRVGDSGPAPDITRVEIEEYSHLLPLGTSIVFTVTFAGQLRCTSDGDGVPMVVAVDTDQNPDTGSAFYGTEFELAPDAIGDAMFLRAHGWTSGRFLIRRASAEVAARARRSMASTRVLSDWRRGSALWRATR